jgi:DNA-binding response OmpR family regulator
MEQSFQYYCKKLYKGNIMTKVNRFDKIKNKAILFVEDDKGIRENYVEYLKTNFNTVYGAENGEVAYEMYEKLDIDLIILDINMPVMTGLQLARKIREKDQKIKLIIMSAYSEREMLLQAANLSIQRYLIKPLNRYTFDEEVYDTLYVFERKFKRVSNLLRYDVINNELFRGSEKVIITKKETLLFKTLITRIGKVYSDEDIKKNVWLNKESKDVTSNALKRMVSSLRKKLGDADVIKNIYRHGYYVDNKGK